MDTQYFRCDDAAGFQLSVSRAVDGDFHIQVVPSPGDMDGGEEDAALFGACYNATVRVRAPMHGGGGHPALWHALAGLWTGKTPRARIAQALYDHAHPEDLGGLEMTPKHQRYWKQADAVLEALGVWK